MCVSSSSRLQLVELVLDRLDLVGELAALAPDVLEAVGDLGQQLLDGRALVSEEAPRDTNVSQLNGCVRHVSSLLVELVEDVVDDLSERR